MSVASQVRDLEIENERLAEELDRARRAVQDAIDDHAGMTGLFPRSLEGTEYEVAWRRRTAPLATEPTIYNLNRTEEVQR